MKISMPTVYSIDGCLRCATFLLVLFFSTNLLALPPDFIKETILQGLDNPVNLVQMPDGQMLVLEKGGKIKVFDPSNPAAGTTTLLTISNINSGQERGLASVALDPNFSSNGYLYVYYTQNTNDSRNRISRFNYVNNSIRLSSEVLVWEDNERYKSCCHFGGGLDFGPDQMLYLTTGEEFDGEQAQDLTQAGGKIIRLNVENISPATPWVRGATNSHIIPSDNPGFIMDGPGGNLDEIWALGLRNPFRAHWDLPANRFFIGEVGGNVQATAREDLHLGRAGANYGWPYCEGQCSNSAFDDAIYDYAHTVATPAGGAIVAGVVYRGTQFPISFQGRFFIADYALGFIKYLRLNPDNQVASVKDFDLAVGGSPVAIEQGLDGSLYVVDYINGRLIRYSYNPQNQPPVITFASSTVNNGPAPLSVTFSAEATDADGDTLSYSWSLGDGIPNRLGKSITTTYNNEGAYFVRVSVSDGKSTTLSDVIKIDVGTPPIARIQSPTNGSFFIAGDQINYSGVIDNATNLNQYDYSWQIELVHNAHTHPVLSSQQRQGTLNIATNGHDYLGDTAYRLTFTATDAIGLSDTTSTTIYPRKVDMTISTTPANLTVNIDGIQQQTPIVYDTLVGFEHVLSAQQSQCVDGQTYVFDGWSNGKNRIHTLPMPGNDFALQAAFIADGACSAIPEQGLVAWLETDSEVTTNASREVTSWLDRSVSANHINIVHGNPTLEQNRINGLPAIAFDGLGDALLRTNTLTDFPFAATDRTIFLLARYDSTGSGGFGYGRSTSNNVFGLSVNANGMLRVNGFGRGNDFGTDSQATGSGWLLHEAHLENNQLNQYLNESPIDSATHAFNTTGQKLVLGADLDENPYVDMDVAALLIYNRALDTDERVSVYNYLNNKYFNQGNQNQPPIARADNYLLARGSSVILDVRANDIDPDGDIENSTVTIASSPISGSTVVNTDGTITYTHDNSSSTTDNFTYRIADQQGASAMASVNLTFTDQPEPTPELPNLGLVVHLDANIDVVTNQQGNVVSWGDQSGRFNDLSETEGKPKLALNALNGHSVLEFDGVTDILKRSGNLSALPVGSADRSIFALVQYKSSGYGGISYGAPQVNQTFGLGTHPNSNLMIQGWGVSNDFQSSINAIQEDWFVHGVVVKDNQIDHFKNMDLIDTFDHQFATNSNQLVLGAEIDGNPKVHMNIASVLIYDKAVSATERSTIVEYFSNKYLNTTGGNNPNNAPVARNDNADVDFNSQTLIPILDNDTDDDGLVIETSVTLQQLPSFGSATVNSDGTTTYTHGSNSASNDEFTYSVADDQGLRSDEATVNISIRQPIPPGNQIPPTAITNLVAHYEAANGVTEINNAVRQWKDQSGNGNHLFALGSDPTLLSSELNGRPVISFDGINDQLAKNKNVSGFPQGNSDRSMYTVVNYLSAGYGGITYGTPATNQIYGHAVHPNSHLMLQGWGVRNDFTSAQAGTNRGWIIQSSILEDSKLRHHLDDVLIDSRTHEYNTSTQTIVLGAEIDRSPYVRMQVGEVLLFDRALTSSEHQQLLTYLSEKYNL